MLTGTTEATLKHKGNVGLYNAKDTKNTKVWSWFMGCNLYVGYRRSIEWHFQRCNRCDNSSIVFCCIAELEYCRLLYYKANTQKAVVPQNAQVMFSSASYTPYVTTTFQNRCGKYQYVPNNIVKQRSCFLNGNPSYWLEYIYINIPHKIRDTRHDRQNISQPLTCVTIYSIMKPRSIFY